MIYHKKIFQLELNYCSQSQSVRVLEFKTNIQNKKIKTLILMIYHKKIFQL